MSRSPSSKRPEAKAVVTTATPAAHGTDYRPNERSDFRNYDRPGPGPIYQADARNDVAAPARQQRGGNNPYYGNQTTNNDVPGVQNNPYMGGAYNNGPMTSWPSK